MQHQSYRHTELLSAGHMGIPETSSNLASGKLHLAPKPDSITDACIRAYRDSTAAELHFRMHRKLTKS